MMEDHNEGNNDHGRSIQCGMGLLVRCTDDENVTYVIHGITRYSVASA